MDESKTDGKEADIPDVESELSDEVAEDIIDEYDYFYGEETL